MGYRSSFIVFVILAKARRRRDEDEIQMHEQHERKEEMENSEYDGGLENRGLWSLDWTLGMEGGIQTHERHRETGTGDMNRENRRSKAKTTEREEEWDGRHEHRRPKK